MTYNYLTKPYSPEYNRPCLLFNCGNLILDSFIHNFNNQNPCIGKTYLWLNDGINETDLIGYYTLTTGLIDMVDDYNNRIKIGGSIHISHFAINNDYRGKLFFGNTKYSDSLLNDCMSRIYYIQDKFVGFSFITLQSTKEGHTLYLNHGFNDIEDDMTFSGDKDEKFCFPMYYALELENI